jgi:hypothetical protein
LQNQVVAPPGVVARHWQAVVPKLHVMPAITSHVDPGVGSVVGQGATHVQRSPPPPAGPAKPLQVQVAPSLKGQLRPTVVHIALFAGSVVGQVPQVQRAPVAPAPAHRQLVVP